MRFAAVILLLAVRSATAHPEHPGGAPLGADLLHLLTEPDHLALLLAPLAAAAGVVLYVRWRRRARQPGTAGAAGTISRPRRR